MYNPTYYKNNQIYDTRNAKYSFKHFTLRDGYKVGMFQGNRGDRPDLDFIIKFLPPGPTGRTRTPKHIHWVVDLLLKMEHYRNEVFEVITYYRRFYEFAQPFKTIEERNNYKPEIYIQISDKYPQLEHKGTYSLEYVCILIELFTICETITTRKQNV